MSAAEPPYPGTSNGRYVPMDLYLEDRGELKVALRDLTTEVRAMRREMDRDDGKEVAEEAATSAVAGSRRSRREVVRDIGLCVLSSALAVVGAVVTANVVG